MLHQHQKKTKYCLKIQKIKEKDVVFLQDVTNELIFAINEAHDAK